MTDTTALVPDCAPPNPNPSTPKLALPPGSCDSHCHVVGPFDRFMPPPDRSYTPAEAPETELRRLHDRLRIDRAVIVQSQGHGMDHAPLLDALKTGARRYRGVCLLTPASSDALIERFDAAGVRGVRFNFMRHLGGHLEPDAMREVVAKVKPHGWHVSVHVAGLDVVEHSELIRSLDAPVVIDHMARPALEDGPDGAAVSEVRRLIDTGKVWVKLSGAERLSKAGAPYHDVVPIARSLAAYAPERVLWATDWPHVNLKNPMPDDADLVDLIEAVVPSEAARHRLLVDNPAEFFGFPSVQGQ